MSDFEMYMRLNDQKIYEYPEWPKRLCNYMRTNKIKYKTYKKNTEKSRKLKLNYPEIRDLFVYMAKWRMFKRTTQ